MIPNAMSTFQNGLIFLLFSLFFSLVPSSWAQQRNNKLEEFSCPEEFGYHPHPTNCSLYYVCVFRGALLESCSGGLMYSHDLQTCDWPRNVGCGTSAFSSEPVSNANSLYTVKGSTNQLVSRQTTPSWRHETLRYEQQDQAPDKHLYAEEYVGPADEMESDRQQRVYRRQPPVRGEVARDRDGIIRHVNALQTSGPEKMKSVPIYSFSPHHQSFRPSSSIPLHVVDQPANPVPTTPKTILNFTKFQPYNVYDVESDIFSVNDNYKVAQIPEDPSVPHHSPIKNVVVNHSKQQNYRFRSTVDDSNQLPERVPNTKVRLRGSVTYANGQEEYESASSNGKVRPIVKSPTVIISKSEPVDIYTNLPKRPVNVYPTPQMDKTAAKCRKDICMLPDCSCGGKDVPGDLPIEDTPQIVLLTFDDSVNELNKGLYSDLFEKGRVNPNGCPILATFYVSHEWTDYSMVQNLYANGHEIASHSVSHSFGEQFSQSKWTEEIVGQREILAAYGGVRQEDIRGMRAPFLAVGGNKMFKMLYDSNFTYDSSMPIYENRPPSWPYTLDYKLFHDCMIPPCPTKSYPGVWEVPMVMWQDLNGGRCSMGDACSNPLTVDGVQKMLMKNFERHFTTNRAPFGLFYHSSWFTQPHHKRGFINFLESIMNMPEIWLVTNWQAIQWARDPTPMSRLNQFTPFGCDYPERPKRCNNSKVCNLWHKSGVRYLKTCQPCPDVYPWIGKTGVVNSKVVNDDIPSE